MRISHSRIVQADRGDGGAGRQLSRSCIQGYHANYAASMRE